MRLRSLWPLHVFDALVIALAIAAEIEVWVDPAQTPRAGTAVAALLWTLPLLLWRRFPVGAPVTVFVTLAAESLVLPGEAVTHSWVNAIALIAAFGVAGKHENMRVALSTAAGGF